MKQLFTLAWVILSVGPVVNAQQDPLYSQYINNPFVINPAYGGITNNLNAPLTIDTNGPDLKVARKPLMPMRTCH